MNRRRGAEAQRIFARDLRVFASQRRSFCDRGSALLIAIMAAALLSALGLGLSLITNTEMLIASSYATGQELAYAAEAGLEIAEQELRSVPDWNLVLEGAVRSGWVDGLAASPRVLEDGSVLKLDEATNLANCGQPASCSDSEMDAVAELRPWGINNPRWRLFAHSPMNRGYVAVWVADDAAENDGNPVLDGTTAANPGTGVIAVRSEAYGAGGGHKVVEATVRRGGGAAGISRLSWVQIR